MKITRDRLKDIIKREMNLLSEASYTVKRGDTLSQIAKDNNIDINDLLAANPQFNADKLDDWSDGDTPDTGDKPGEQDRNPNWIFPGDTIELEVSPDAELEAEVVDEVQNECKADINTILDELITKIEEIRVRYSE
jgi:dsDNA-specific endonuclease/ATPase MutS2